MASNQKEKLEATGLVNEEANDVQCSEKLRCSQIWKLGTEGMEQSRDS